MHRDREKSVKLISEESIFCACGGEKKMRAYYIILLRNL